MKHLEKNITRLVKKFFDSLISSGHPLFYWKVSDRFTSGIPDFSGCYNGRAFYVELKALGEKPRPLQEYVISKIKKAKGLVGSFDQFDDFKNWFESKVMNGE